VTVAARPFPSADVLLPAVKSILATYEGTAVTVRQLYYRLVGAGVIPNSLRSYKNLGAALTKWRRRRAIPVRAFEDRTRGMNRLDTGWRADDPVGWMRACLKAGVEQAQRYDLAHWYGQTDRVVVAVEKQALEGPFTEVCEEAHVDLAVCRGYPSLSFIREVADALTRGDTDRDDRDNVVLYFGDLDPSGLNIPETLERDLKGFGQSFRFERIALTREQVEEMDLIPAPVKMTDSRAAGFVAEHGDEVYELDAIEPVRLRAIVRGAIAEYYDDGVAAEREETVGKGRKRITRHLAKAGVLKFLESLGTDDGGSGGEADADGDDGEDA
jgi:hypothetical protein